MGFYGKLVGENNTNNSISIEESLNSIVNDSSYILEELNMYTNLFTINESIEVVTEANIKQIAKTISDKIKKAIDWVIEKFNELISKIKEFFLSKKASEGEKLFEQNKNNINKEDLTESTVLISEDGGFNIKVYKFDQISKVLEKIIINDQMNLEGLSFIAFDEYSEKFDKAYEDLVAKKKEISEILNDDNYIEYITNKFDALNYASKCFGSNKYYRSQLRSLNSFAEKATKNLKISSSIQTKFMEKANSKNIDNIDGDNIASIASKTSKIMNMAISIYSESANVCSTLIKNLDHVSFSCLKYIIKK